MEIKDQIVDDINSNFVMLYMKGTKDMPMCGFSATMVKILNHYGVSYKATNILEDPNIRVELSKHSNWPTIPQLFVDGNLIGGCDIALEMHNDGTLEPIFNKKD